MFDDIPASLDSWQQFQHLQVSAQQTSKALIA
jgi:hypothetical protein